VIGFFLFSLFRNIPKILREKWLKKFRHHKLKISFASSSQIQKDYLKEHHPSLATQETREVATEKQEDGLSQPKDAKEVKYEDTDSDKEDEKAVGEENEKGNNQKKNNKSNKASKDDEEVGYSFCFRVFITYACFSF
jgi:hypothetical protein